MTSLKPLEIALTAWTKKRDPDDRDGRLEDARALAATGVFSVRQILMIVDLPSTFAYSSLAGVNPTRRGGRFNPESLHDIYDVATQWMVGRTADKAAVKRIVAHGTSERMLSRLTGIHYNTIFGWVKP